MKKRTIFQMLLLSTSLAWLGSCHKDYPEPSPYHPIDYTVLPPITQTGANTFGCMVDGVVWVPRIELWVPWYDKAAQLNEKAFTGRGGIDCRLLTENLDEWMEVTFGPTYFQTGIYHSSISNSNPTVDAQFRSAGKRYSTDRKDSIDNWVNLTSIDTVRNIVSGTFNFVLHNEQNKNDLIILSNGRFDMPYNAN